MSTSNPVGTQGRGPRSANERWKSTWSTWLTRSTILAAGLHAAILIIWPAWEYVRLESPEEELEFVQIVPIATYGGIVDPGAGVVAALPTEEELRLRQEEAAQGTEEETETVDETAGVRLPTDAYAYIPEIIPDGTAVDRRNNPPLILNRLTAITPEVAPLAPEVGWPQLRNPTVITRYLGGRFNDLHRTGSSGYVSVAMWINERGMVEWARVSESSGDTRLDDIALALFEEVAAFAPARSKGRGIPVQVTISVPFTLPW